LHFSHSYRDGITHQSVLSSLSASYNGIGELSYYEDLAKNIDANLAEVDMESFRTEDIHSLLTTTIPTLCHKKSSDNVKCKRNLDLDNSICKSELLFSPVRESHISVDSLDMDGYEEDIILTCQANKDNYTIAFEGSVMYSDESFYGER
jgi:iporin